MRPPRRVARSCAPLVAMATDRGVNGAAAARPKEQGAEQERVHAMVNEHDRRRRAELSSADYAARHVPSGQVFDAKASTRKRQRDHAEATDAAVRLGLQRFQHGYERKKARKMIPPGWFDVCHLGLHDALKMVSEVAKKRESANCGRVVT